jgi:hypothetical protein
MPMPLAPPVIEAVLPVSFIGFLSLGHWRRLNQRPRNKIENLRRAPEATHLEWAE